jgi:hypothetical protein
MEDQTNLIEPLLEKAEAYSKTSWELLRLKALAKTTDVASTALSRTVLVLILQVFLFTLNTALALWIGDLLGKIYYGFFIVAGFNALVSVILMITHPSIKKTVSNNVIRQLFN